jgi:hypothetical protein
MQTRRRHTSLAKVAADGFLGEPVALSERALAIRSRSCGEFIVSQISVRR